MTFDLAVSIAIVLAAPLGLRSSIRLILRYRRTAPILGWRERLILGTFAVVASTITVVALWVGYLTIRRLLDLPPHVGTAPVTGIMAIVVLLIPAALDWVVNRVARE